jgi:carbamate kinase
MSAAKTPTIIAIGGNALIMRGERGTVTEQMGHASACMAHVAGMVSRGEPVVITHGNGPIVGNIVIQMECAGNTVPPMPLFIADADSEGGIGFMLQQSLYNHLVRHMRGAEVVSVVTQVVVEASDPAFANPTKPIGPFYTEPESNKLAAERGWKLAQDAGRGWRRVVASPKPLRIVEAAAIRRIAESGIVVIAAGGGGVPVVQDDDGTLHGVDAVVDKDRASAVLAREIGAKRMIILTSVDSVYLDYGRQGERRIERMGVDEAIMQLAAGQFPPGSMGPKVEASIGFLNDGGKEVIITSPEKLEDALDGKSGTLISG